MHQSTASPTLNWNNFTYSSGTSLSSHCTRPPALRPALQVAIETKHQCLLVKGSGEEMSNLDQSTDSLPNMNETTHL